MKGPFNKKIGALLIVVLALAALAAFRISLGEVDAARIVAEIRRVQDHWWALPAYLAAYVTLTSAFVPAVLLHMAAGAAWGFQTALALNVLSFNATASLQFALARRAGRERVAAFLARRRIRALDELSQAHGLLGVILIRLVPIPAMGVATGLGVSPVRWRHFALGSLIGTLPYIAVYTYFASALVEGEPGAERETRWRVGLATALILALAVASALIRARIARSRARRRGSA